MLGIKSESLENKSFKPDIFKRRLRSFPDWNKHRDYFGAYTLGVRVTLIGFVAISWNGGTITIITNKRIFLRNNFCR